MNRQTLKSIVVGGLFLVPFIPFLTYSSFFFPYVTTKAFAWRFVVEIIFALWLVLAAMVPAYRPKKTMLLYAALAFLAVIGVADLLGVAPLKSFWSNYERMDGFVSLLHLGAYFIVAGAVMTEELWNKWWKTELIASLLVGGHALLQLLGTLRLAQSGVRVDGTFGNATYLAVYMLFNIFIAALFLIRERHIQKSRWLYGGLIIFQTFILYYTATRGAILGLLGGVLVFAILNIWNTVDRGVRKASLVGIAAVVLLVGGFFLARNTEFVTQSPVLSRFATLSPAELQTQGRYYVWPMAWKGFLERPLLGWGQENFSYVFQEHYSAKMYALEPWFDRAHNIFLDWLVAGGVLGLLTYLSLYGAALYLIWRRATLSFLERAVLTSLMAAYFFHNMFVFDHLVSYILFFTLLAYIHGRTAGETVWKHKELGENGRNAVMLGAALLLIGSLYVVEWRPLSGNLSLLNALKAVSVKDYGVATDSFRSALEASNLGHIEATEQAVNNVSVILQSEIALEKKNEFYNFLKETIAAQDARYASDARHELLAGQFLALVGNLDEGMTHLTRARTLMPEKQQVYFELGSAYISAKQFDNALAVFKEAYELAPQYEEARIIYLIGAIYARNTRAEAEMLALIPLDRVTMDSRIVSAYYGNGRMDRVRAILEARKKLDPANAATYDELLKQL